MKFNKNILALAISGALFSTGASAIVNLSTPTAAIPFARELITAANTTITQNGTTLDLAGFIGWGVAANNHLYIRIDLVNGQFATGRAGTDMTNPSAVAGFNSTLSAGGGANSTFVIFDVSGTAPINLTDDFNFNPGNLILLNQAQDITATVKFYTDSGAAAANAAPLAQLSGPYVTRTSALETAYSALSTTADSATAYTQFLTGTPGFKTTTKALLGTVNTSIVATVRNPATGTNPVAAAALATSSNLVLTGQFAASALPTDGIYAAVGGTNCALHTLQGVLSAGNTIATLTGFAGVTLVPGNIDICMEVNGTTPIPAQTVTGVLTFAGQVSPAVIPTANGNLGPIIRDGLQLQSPWFTTHPSYSSRFVLTNTSTVNAPYTAAVVTEAGNTCTTGPGVNGTLTAGQQKVIAATDICSSLSASQRASVTFTITGPDANIQGVYNVVNPTTGSVSVSNLMRPTTN